MSYNTLFASDGDLTNSRPVLQLRVAQGAILDRGEDRRRDSCKNNDEYVKPYGSEIKIQEKGCIPGEIALKKRTTGRPALTVDDIYAGPAYPKLDQTLVPHFTHLNQIPIQMKLEDFKKLPDDEKRAFIENEFQIGGIVGTVAEPAYEGKDLGKEDFVVEIGGIRSIINNSPTHTILQGQLVVVRAPDFYDKSLEVPGKKRPRNPDGTEPGKVLVVTEPYDPSQVISQDTLNKLIGELDNYPKKFYEDCFPKNCSAQCIGDHPVYLPRHFIQHVINFMIHSKVCLDNPGLDGKAHEDEMEKQRKEMLEMDGDKVKGLTENAKALLKKVFTPGGKMNNIVSNLMNSYHMINHRYQSLVLGQAQSDAAPGTRFDIKFGSYTL
jgi:hypothetical protein